MLLPISGDSLFCQSLAVFPSLGVRRVVRIDAEHIPARWQHIVIEDWVSAWSWGYRPAIQRTDHIIHFCLSRGRQQLLDARPLRGIVVHGTGRLIQLFFCVGLS